MNRMRKPQSDRYEFVEIPERLQAFVVYAGFNDGGRPVDGVELMLTGRGVHFARSAHGSGSSELARWVMEHSLWQGERSQENVAQEISAHCIFAHWPLISKRANPVNIEYFQSWPISLWLQARDRLMTTVQRLSHRNNRAG